MPFMGDSHFIDRRKDAPLVVLPFFQMLLANYWVLDGNAQSSISVKKLLGRRVSTMGFRCVSVEF